MNKETQTVEEIVEEFKEMMKGMDGYCVSHSIMPFLEKYPDWLHNTLTTLQQAHQQELEKVRREAKEVVVKEHYELEEWFAHQEKPPQVLLRAHQRSMRTRNAITKALTPKDLTDKE